MTISVVIAAHNEAAVIGRCLDALFAGAPATAAPTAGGPTAAVPTAGGPTAGAPTAGGPTAGARAAGAPAGPDITVVANGCSDGTAAVAASRPGVRVVELTEPGKANALNAGDAVAQGFPRVYLDADIVLPPGALAELAAALSGPGRGGAAAPLAVVPRRALELAGRPLLVRAFFAINSRLPVYRNGLFGRGVIALSAAGRARFEVFPDLIADDLFLDSLFTDAEKRQVDGVAARIATPRRTRDLVRRLARVRAGNAAMRATGTGVRSAARSSWLRDVVLPRPWLAPAGACYAALTATAALAARRTRTSNQWGRDDSSRLEHVQ